MARLGRGRWNRPIVQRTTQLGIHVDASSTTAYLYENVGLGVSLAADENAVAYLYENVGVLDGPDIPANLGLGAPAGTIIGPFVAGATVAFALGAPAGAVFGPIILGASSSLVLAAPAGAAAGPYVTGATSALVLACVAGSLAPPVYPPVLRDPLEVLLAPSVTAARLALSRTSLEF